LLIGIRFPQWAPRHGYAFVEFSRRHGDFAITSAAVLIETDAAGKITRASVTIGGMGTAPSRARAGAGDHRTSAEPATVP
jgi:carbon-monoxide dehydrogenase medium subunit